MFVWLWVVFGVVTYLWKDQIINRQFSNTGHFTSIKTALAKIQEKPIFGQWAGFAWPASHQLESVKEYNPENQFLQILLEYWIVGFAWWIFLYGYLIYLWFQAYKVSLQSHISKTQKYHSFLVVACALGLIGLSIEWLVLHSFVDRMIVYPFMALFWLSYSIYFKTKGNFKH
jgi:O-antigen ligase